MIICTSPVVFYHIRPLLLDYFFSLKFLKAHDHTISNFFLITESVHAPPKLRNLGAFPVLSSQVQL